MKKLAAFAAMTALLVFVGAGFVQGQAFVLPHVLEKSGRIGAGATFTFDTLVLATYVGGQAGITGSGGATVEVFLFNNNTGGFMQVNGQDICNGTSAVCSFDIGGSAANRKATINIETLIESRVGAGNFTGTVLGYAIFVVGGADPANAKLQAFISNSHTGAFDLAVFGFEPQLVSAAAN